MIDKNTYSILNEALSTSLKASSKERVRKIASSLNAKDLQSNIEQLTSIMPDPSDIKKLKDSTRDCEKEMFLAPNSKLFNTKKNLKEKFYRLNKSNYIISFIINLFQNELERKASESSTCSDDVLWTLPSDMVLNILQYLNVQDIAQLSLTSHQADQFLELNETKKFLAQRLSPGHRKELSPNYTNLPSRAFLNWLRISTSNVASTLKGDYEPILYQPENFVDYLSFSTNRKFDNKQPEHQLTLGLLCRNENAVVTALRTTEWNLKLIADAASFDSWNILNNYYLIEHELTTDILQGAILSGDPEIFDYAIRHWHLPPETEINLVDYAVRAGNLDMLDNVMHHPQSNTYWVITNLTLEAAAHSGQVAMFNKILNYLPDESDTAISQSCLDHAANSGNIEMLNLILAHPKKPPAVTIKQSTLKSAALYGQTDIFDKILDHPTLSETSEALTIDQDLLDSAALSGQVKMFNKIYHHPRKDSAIEVQKHTVINAMESGQIEMFNLVINHSKSSFDLTGSDLTNLVRLDYDMFVTFCEKSNPDPSVISEFLQFDPGSESMRKYAEDYILQFEDNNRASISFNR